MEIMINSNNFFFHFKNKIRWINLKKINEKALVKTKKRRICCFYKICLNKNKIFTY